MSDIADGEYTENIKTEHAYLLNELKYILSQARGAFDQAPERGFPEWFDSADKLVEKIEKNEIHRSKNLIGYGGFEVADGQTLASISNVGCPNLEKYSPNSELLKSLQTIRTFLETIRTVELIDPGGVRGTWKDLSQISAWIARGALSGHEDEEGELIRGLRAIADIESVPVDWKMRTKMIEGIARESLMLGMHTSTTESVSAGIVVISGAAQEVDKELKSLIGKTGWIIREMSIDEAKVVDEQRGIGAVKVVTPSGYQTVIPASELYMDIHRVVLAARLSAEALERSADRWEQIAYEKGNEPTDRASTEEVTHISEKNKKVESKQREAQVSIDM